MSNRVLMRIAHALVGLAVVLCTMALCAPEAFAAERAQLGLCDPEAPVPQRPDSDVPGIFIERPQNIVVPPDPNRADAARLFSTSGTAGMGPIVYDLGCGIDPRKVESRIGAWTNSTLAGWFITSSQGFTMATSAIEQYAWDPAWIGGLLGDLSEATVGQAQARVVLPFLGLGLLICTILLLVRARKGNVAGVMQAVAWVLLTLIVAALVIAKPTTLATTTQAATGEVVNTLYGDSGNPTLSATEAIMQEIHYQGWLRRTFGNDDSETARRYGPVLLAATRITWQEDAATNPALAESDDEREQILKAREAMLERKADLFNDTAEKIKKEDPEAYTFLTGTRATFLDALYESGFAFVASIFRILAGLVVVLALILLTVLGLAWLLALPWLVTPWGEALGRGLLDATARSIGYVAITGVGTWMYVIFTGAAMRPGVPGFFTFILVGVGAFAFWAIIRPDRKILSLMTAGKVRGRGKWTRKALKYGIMAVAASKIVSEDAVKAAAQGAKPTPPPKATSPRPPAPPVPRPATKPRKPPASVRLPPGAAPPPSVYQRPTTKPKPRVRHPVPPPPGATGAVNPVYTRPGAKSITRKRP